jgi:hypothetical protein
MPVLAFIATQVAIAVAIEVAPYVLAAAKTIYVQVTK